MSKRVITILALVCFVCVQGLVFADTIEMLKGKPKLKVQIVKEGLNKVIYKKAGLPDQSVPSDQVKDVKYHVGAADYKTAVDAYNGSDFMTAAELFREYGDSLSNDKKALIAHCDFMAADSLYKSAQIKEAILAFTRFANTYQDHRLYPDALLNRAKAYIANRDIKKAQDGFITLKGQVSKKGLGDYWKHEVEYWLIRIREDKNLKAALDDYKALYEASKEFPVISSKSRLGIGQVLIKQKKYKDATSFFTEIIDNRTDADSDVVAGAYLGRGRCILSKPNPKEEDYKSAIYDLLRVVLQYPEASAWQAEALFWSGKCFQNLGGKDSGKRWQGLFRRLQREWPGTTWAQQASKEI